MINSTLLLFFFFITIVLPQTIANRTADDKLEPWTNFYDDLFPFEYDGIDCGEATAITQRQLQLDLVLSTSKNIYAAKFKSEPESESEPTTVSLLDKISAGNFSSDESLDHFFFASCNHQKREQEMWYHFYLRTYEPTSPSDLSNPAQYFKSFNRRDFGQLFLWLGDAVYLDRPPNPYDQSSESKRADMTRQLWRKHYCLGVRQQIPVNGVIDDHDFGLNNAGFTYADKFATKQLFLDFLDFPGTSELGASRQFKDIILQQCGAAIGCHTLPTTIPSTATPNTNINVIFPPLSPQCTADVIETIQTMDSFTKSGKLKELSQLFPASVQTVCYVNWQTILLQDQLSGSIYEVARNYQSPTVFNDTKDTTHLATQLQRKTIEELLTEKYKARRDRHGTYDIQTYGPMFRKIKTLLLDVRVGHVNFERMLFESHWTIYEEELQRSIIPSIMEAYFPNNILVPTNEITQVNQGAPLFEAALGKLMTEYVKFDKKTGHLLLSIDNAEGFQELETFQTHLQCDSPNFALSNLIHTLSTVNGHQYLEHGADVLLIGSGLLVVSWGKMASEGWREQYRERTRILTRTGKYIALSRKYTDEWKIYIQARHLICGNFHPSQTAEWNNEIPMVTYKSPTSSTTNIDYSILDVIKPLAVSYLTGDIHYSEAARSYIPIDLTIPDPPFISNTASVASDTIYNSPEDEQLFNLTNDTIHNGNLAIQQLQQFSNSTREFFIDSIDQKLDINAFNTKKDAFGAFSQKYIIPFTDITTSGITHGWGGGDPNATAKIFSLKKLFEYVLRPEFTNFDFQNKHGFLIDDLEYAYANISIEKSYTHSVFQSTNTNNAKNNNDEIKTTATQPMFVAMNSTNFDAIRQSQDRVFVLHNIGEVHIDWHHDIIHFTIDDKTLTTQMYYSSRLEHLRAYTFPQINAFSTRYDSVFNPQSPPMSSSTSFPFVKPAQTDQVSFDSEAYSQRVVQYLEDMRIQFSQEASTRLVAPRGVSQNQIMLTLIFFFIFILVAIFFCYHQCCKKSTFCRRCCCCCNGSDGTRTTVQHGFDKVSESVIELQQTGADMLNKASSSSSLRRIRRKDRSSFLNQQQEVKHHRVLDDSNDSDDSTIYSDEAGPITNDIHSIVPSETNNINNTNDTNDTNDTNTILPNNHQDSAGSHQVSSHRQKGSFTENRIETSLDDLSGL